MSDEQNDLGENLLHITIILAIVFLIVVCYGDPDILDGWVKMANK